MTAISPVLYAEFGRPARFEQLTRRHPDELFQFEPAQYTDADEQGWLVSSAENTATHTLFPLETSRLTDLEHGSFTLFRSGVDRITGDPKPSPLFTKLSRLGDDDAVLADNLLRESGRLKEYLGAGHTPRKLAEECSRSERALDVRTARTIAEVLVPECFYVAASTGNSLMNRVHTVLGELVGLAVVDHQLPSGQVVSGLEPVVRGRVSQPGLFPIGLRVKPYFYDVTAVDQILHPKSSQETVS